MNKFVLPALLICLLSIQACTGDDATNDNNSTATTNTPTANTLTTEGSFATPVLPDRNKEKVQLLLRTHWVAEHWVNHADNSQNKLYKGRWWKFNEDGTYTMGQWQETLTNGSWVVYNDGPKELLHLDAANDELDMEFEMQAMSQLKDYMSWVGTKTYNMQSIAVKSISLLSMPTKAQFGVPE
jgi:hypothetical protein